MPLSLYIICVVFCFVLFIFLFPADNITFKMPEIVQTLVCPSNVKNVKLVYVVVSKLCFDLKMKFFNSFSSSIGKQFPIAKRNSHSISPCLKFQNHWNAQSIFYLYLNQWY